MMAGALWAAPPEVEVQGLYQGEMRDGSGARKLEARVVAQGDHQFRVLLRRMAGDDVIGRAELTAKLAGEAVVMTGKAGDVEWQGQYDAASFKGTCGPGGTFELKKIERKSPTLGLAPPAGAVVLLGGKGVERMERANGSEWYLGDMKQHGWRVWEASARRVSEQEPTDWPDGGGLPAGWKWTPQHRTVDRVIGVDKDGSIQVPQGGMKSMDAFAGGFDLHVEMMIPFQPKQHGQGRGNSGCYLPNGDEIQVLDSFGECTYLGGGAGGFYRYHDPHCMEKIDGVSNKDENQFTLAANPPETWQTYDVQYRVDTQDGKPTGKPKLTMLHNGIKVHDNCPLNHDARSGHFSFQDHGNPVRYRNIWVLPVK